MNPFRKLSQDPYFLTVLVLIVVLIYFKSSVLHLPFYWDEAWVYEPAVRAMYQNGPSLLPDAIDSSLSRGHTLLFHCLGALWMDLFGTKPLILRLFAFTISILLILATYITGHTLGSGKVGLGAVLLLITTESFLSQSSFLLPEILLALFCLLAVLGFVTKHWIAYVVFASSALYTKESALILIIAILCWQLANDLGKVRTVGIYAIGKKLLIICIPLIMVSLFFAYQKYLLGWVFFPEHIDLMNFEPIDIIYKIKKMYETLFESNGAILLTYSFAFGATIIWNGRNFKLSALIILLYVTAVKVIWGRWELPLWPSAIVFLLCLSLIIYLQFIKNFEGEFIKRTFTGLASIFTIGFICFSAMNFYSERYLICVLPFIYVGSLLFIELATNKIHNTIFPVLVVLFVVTRIFYIPDNSRVNDTRLNYVDGISVHQQLVTYCEEHGLQDSIIQSPYMDSYYLTNEHAGYLSGNSFQNVSSDTSSKTRYIIYSYTEYELEQSRPLVVPMSFVLLERFERGNAWEELYIKPIL